ncbi:hypothetical protein DIPPA_11847 [Diplonema papillatum]|nr:hypothetical protein DIPPA_11847 [Diplonema papillatum]
MGKERNAVGVKLPPIGWRASENVIATPAPPTSEPVGRAPRRQEKDAIKDNCSPLSCFRAKEKLKELEARPVLGKDLGFRESQERDVIAEEEAWTRTQHIRLFRFYFEDTILYPKLRQLQNVTEVSRRRDISRLELSVRQNFVHDFGEVATTLAAVSEQLDIITTLESLQRSTTVDLWMTSFSRMTASCAMGAELLRAVDEIEVQEEDSRTLFAQQKRNEAEIVERCAIEGEAQQALCRALQDHLRSLCENENDMRQHMAAAERDARFDLASSNLTWMALSVMGQSENHLLLRKETMERFSLAATLLPCSLRLVEQREILARTWVSTTEAESRRRVNGERQQIRGDLTLWIGSTQQVELIQKWWLAARAFLIGRRATNAKIGEWCRAHRHDKFFAKKRADLKRHRLHVVQQLADAEEEAASLYTLRARIVALHKEEDIERVGVVNDETWQRKQIHADFLFVLIDEMLTPARRWLAKNDEPLDRRSIATEEATSRRSLNAYQRSDNAAIHARGRILAEVKSRAVKLSFYELLARADIRQKQVKDMESLSRTILHCRHRVAHTKIDDAARHAAKLCTVVQEESMGRLRLRRLCKHFFLELEEYAARPLIYYEELRAFTTCLEHSEAFDRIIVESQRADMFSGSLQLFEHDTRAEIISLEHEARKDLISVLTKSIQSKWELLQAKHDVAVLLQRFFRGVRRRAVGWTASKAWIADRLMVLREKRVLLMKQKEVKEEVEEGRKKLREAESDLMQWRLAKVDERRTRTLRSEDRQRRENEADESLMRKGKLHRFWADAEAMLLEEVRRCRTRQEYWRVRIAEDESTAMKQLAQEQSRDRQCTAVLPIQRCCRMHLARKVKKCRIGELIRFVSGPGEETARNAIAAERGSDFAALEEDNERGVIFESELFDRKIALSDFEKCLRATCVHEQYVAVLSSFCRCACDIAEEISRSSDVEKSEIKQQMAAESTLATFSCAEQNSRYMYLHLEREERVDLTVLLETAQRTLLAQCAAHAFDAQKLQLDEEAERLLFAREQLHIHESLVCGKESIWRSLLEVERTFDFRRLRCTCSENESRIRVALNEGLYLRLIYEESETTSRYVVEAERFASLRLLYRQRLEGWERALISDACHRNTIDILLLIEQSERDVLLGEEAVASEIRGLKQTELLSRTDIYNEATDTLRGIAVRRCTGAELVTRKRQRQDEAAALRLLLSFSRDLLVSIISSRETNLRTLVANEEDTWRKRHVQAEAALRVHIAVLPIQRQWRCKSSWIVVRKTSDKLYHQFWEEGSALFNEEAANCMWVAEAQRRGIEVVEEQLAFADIVAGEHEKRVAVHLALSLRDIVWRFDAEETVDRFGTKVEEIYSRQNIASTAEEDFRDVICCTEHRARCLLDIAGVIRTEQFYRSFIEVKHRELVSQTRAERLCEEKLLELACSETTRRDLLEEDEAEDWDVMADTIEMFKEAERRVHVQESANRIHLLAGESSAFSHLTMVCVFMSITSPLLYSV